MLPAACRAIIPSFSHKICYRTLLHFFLGGDIAQTSRKMAAAPGLLTRAACAIVEFSPGRWQRITRDFVAARHLGIMCCSRPGENSSIGRAARARAPGTPTKHGCARELRHFSPLIVRVRDVGNFWSPEYGFLGMDCRGRPSSPHSYLDSWLLTASCTVVPRLCRGRMVSARP